MAREVVVVGGGLAGLTAAYRLAGAGRNVTIFDARTVLGGKARSIDAAADPATRPFHPYDPEADPTWLAPTVDKGYHIFPAWYWELWQLVDDVGAGANFFPRDRSDGSDPRAGGYALFMPPLEDLSNFDGGEGEARSRVANMKTLVPRHWWRLWEWGPPLSMGLTAMGLAASAGRTVEVMTVPDFISTRWYNGDDRASVLQDLIVKALANPSKHTSAYTMRQMFRRWIPTVRTGNSWTPCRGPLQTCLIDPIVAGCVEAGVSFETDQLVSIERRADGNLGSLRFASGRVIDVDDSDVVLALPPDVLLAIARRTPEVLSVRELAQLAHLRTAPMGAIDLYFVDPADVDDYPEHLTVAAFTDRHFSLIESEFGLTGFPISGVPEWEPHLGGAPGLVLQFVCGNVLDIHELPREQFARLLIDQISQYLGFDPERHLIGCVALPGSDEQLTMNDAGTWDRRPPADVKEVPNLFLAGDYVKLSVDVSGMEAAVESGANAARAILLADEVRRNRPRSTGDWERAHDAVDAVIPRPTRLPPWYLRDLVYPLMRAVFVTVHYTVGWLVVMAKWPLVAGRDFVGALHDRYEDSREEEMHEGLAAEDAPSSIRPAASVRSLPVNVPRHRRRKGLGEPVDRRDRLLIAAGLAAVLAGVLSAAVLPLRLEGYSHVDDPISVLGREADTRGFYVAVTVVGWIGLQLLAAVVRKFVPGSQVISWMLAWLGALWLVVGLFPICPLAPDGGTACPDAGATWFQSVHIGSALAMAFILVALPFFTWWQVLRRLPSGYAANWDSFRRISGGLAFLTLATALYFGLTLMSWNSWPAGLAQRLHWAVGHLWVVGVALWIGSRKHRRADGSIARPSGPLRSVDQRSLWA